MTGEGIEECLEILINKIEYKYENLKIKNVEKINFNEKKEIKFNEKKEKKVHSKFCANF